MKKTYILISVLAISACSSPLEKYSVHLANIHYQNDILENIDLSFNDIKNIFSSSNESCIFFYSSTCSPCLEAKENISRYIKEEKHLIYTYDLEDSRLTDELRNLFVNIEDEIYYPNLIFLKDFEVVYSISNERLKDYYDFKNNMKKHVLNTNIFYINYEQLPSFIIEDEFLLFVNDSESSKLNLLNNTFYRDCVFSYAKSSQKKLGIINSKSLPLNDRNPIIEYYSKGILKKSINYVTDELEAKALILDYYK